MQEVIGWAKLCARARREALVAKKEHARCKGDCFNDWVAEQMRTGMGAMFALIKPKALWEDKPFDARAAQRSK